MATASIMAGVEEDSIITTIEDLHPDVLTRVLRHLDGPALASASGATSHLRALSSLPDIWDHLCLSTWPSLNHPRLLTLLSSFPNSHRSFFSDSYPFPNSNPNPSPKSPPPTELISAVDLYHRGTSVFAKVLETETMTSWFLGSPFRVDALDRKELPPQEAAALSPEDLTMSWIVIDPAGRRAANLSSRRPVSVERHWYTGEIQVRFATVLGDGAAVTVVVTCGEEAMHVREMSLTVEDMDGMCLNGRDSLVILQGALTGERKGKGREGEEVVRQRYLEHVRRKKERREEKILREGRLEAGCMLVGVGVFLSFLILMVFR